MMGTFLTVAAIIGLLIFIVGAVVFFLNRRSAGLLMVIGALVYAVAQVILLFDAVI